MSKRLILILALALVVGLTCSAYAEVQNVKVSGDVTALAVTRNNFTLKKPVNNAAPDLATNLATGDYGRHVNAFLSQVRLRVDADLTDNVAATVRLLNERVWGDAGDYAGVTSRSNNDDIVLDLAYVALKEFLYSPLSLVVGRQDLRYGNALIVGRPFTNGISDGHGSTSRYLPNSLDDLSLRQSFDAIKINLNYDPLLVDLVYSRLGQNNVAKHNATNLYGINANYSVDKNLNTELYFWQRSRICAEVAGVVTGTSRTENLRVLGARGTYTGVKNLMLGLEMAYQFGQHVNNAYLYPDELISNNTMRSVRAYAIQAIANYAMPDMEFTPTVGIGYTYLSGEKYKSRRTYTGWSGFYEDQAAGTIYNKILGFSNVQLINLNGSIKPVDDFKIALDYSYLHLNQPYTEGADAVRLSGVYNDPTYSMQAGKKPLGQEVDLKLTYDYTEDVQIGLNAGMFFPSTAFDKVNRSTANQAIASMKVTF